MNAAPNTCRIGFSYRLNIDGWIQQNIDAFDVLEVTLDHYFWGSDAQRAAIEAACKELPAVSHGIGLSLGTADELDLGYLEKVAQAVDRLAMPYYSEHIAFTKVPPRGEEPVLDLANLLPLPKSEAVLEHLIRQVKIVQECVPVPLLLENITYYWDWPDSVFDDANFFNLLCRETGAAILLDVENLYLNSKNLNLDPIAFLDALDPGLVRALHVAGGGIHSGKQTSDAPTAPVLVDTHDQPLRQGTMDLLADVLDRHSPEVIILERDRRLEEGDEILADLANIRQIVKKSKRMEPNVEPTVDRTAS
jgi:uncharacterized protein (UPF0276 family)